MVSVIQTTRPRFEHCPLTAPDQFLQHPAHSTDNAMIGRVVDVSDRLLTCSSSNMRNEIVVGSADHALYAIDILSSDHSKGSNDSARRSGKKPYTTMYSKTCGHCDWVTSVTHLNDGRVLSAGMDGKLCLWSETNRTVCVELENANATGDAFPVSKVVSDMRYNVAFSCSYSGIISIWALAFNESSLPSSSSTGLNDSASMPSITRGGGAAITRVQSGRNYRKQASIPSMVSSSMISPHSHLNGHTEPVLDCSYRDSTFVSGDKGGGMLVWDISRTQLKHRFRAHPGPITAIEIESNGTIFSAGSEGGVKLWDPRLAGTGLVWKMQPFMVQEAASSRTAQLIASRSAPSSSAALGPSRSRSASTRRGGGPARGSGLAPTSSSAPSTSMPLCSSPAVSVMAITHGKGSSDAQYVVVGSGGGGEALGNPLSSAVAVMDLRKSSGVQVVSLWSHSRNGVYSLCAVGDDCLLVGDGVGQLLSYNLLLADEGEHSDRALCYGVGASSKGAVRAINCLGGKVAACGEDGKVLILDYQ